MTKTNTDLTTFGARLRFTREEQGLSRPDLSRLTDRALTARVIDHLESGHTEATISRAEILAKALEVEKLWLLYGEEPRTSTGTENDQPDHEPDSDLDAPVDDPEGPPWDTGKTGSTGMEQPVKPVDTGDNRPSKALDSAGKALESTHECSEHSTATRRFVDEMFEQLELIDALREDGFLKHQRKMPYLMEQLADTAKLLEVDELKEIAFDRKIETGDEDEVETEELTNRIIDTAVLGTDLYDVDFDVLKAFARKNNIERPFLSGWKDHDHLVPLVRPAYRERALNEALTKSTALALAG
ncbi:helix-turn-helix domain-containing protein [Kordiimonas sp.]|uniref:helix-turn-helix domain-containing protein n=1 Tax=Kordiimonas sp. TaxID=1970157 RepID=UPI003B51DC2D